MNYIKVMIEAWNALTTAQLESNAVGNYRLHKKYQTTKNKLDKAIKELKNVEPPPQREWVGLTDDDINFAYLKCEDLDDYARLLEAKLKEKNT